MSYLLPTCAWRYESECWCSLSLSLAGIEAVGSKYSALSNADVDSFRPAYRLDFPDLEQQCYSFRTRGLAPLIRHSYASAQAKFISFCRQLGNLHPSGSPCLMDEWTLCLIIMFLARTLQHLLIKVNLSGFRALHMDQGCSHLLADCLRLQRDIHGIKRCQGTPSSMRLLIRDEISWY